MVSEVVEEIKNPSQGEGNMSELSIHRGRCLLDKGKGGKKRITVFKRSLQKYLKR